MTLLATIHGHAKTDPRMDVLTDPDNCDPPLDPGIKEYVRVLAAEGIETFESCEGGPGHCFPEPTIRFFGDPSEGFRALAIAIRAQLPVFHLRRAWNINNGEACGPFWEMTFSVPSGPA